MRCDEAVLFGHGLNTDLLHRPLCVPHQPHMARLSSEIIPYCFGDSKVRSMAIGNPYTHRPYSRGARHQRRCMGWSAGLSQQQLANSTSKMGFT